MMTKIITGARTHVDLIRYARKPHARTQAFACMKTRTRLHHKQHTHTHIRPLMADPATESARQIDHLIPAVVRKQNDTVVCKCVSLCVCLYVCVLCVMPEGYSSLRLIHFFTTGQPLPAPVFFWNKSPCFPAPKSGFHHAVIRNKSPYFHHAACLSRSLDDPRSLCVNSRYSYVSTCGPLCSDTHVTRAMPSGADEVKCWTIRNG